MLFNFWEINRPALLSQLTEATYVLAQVEDSLASQLVITNLKKKVIELNTLQWQMIYPHELSIEWLDNNLFGLSFFSGQNYFVFTDSEKIEPQVMEYFLKNAHKLSDDHLVFFYKKENALLKKMAAIKNFMKMTVVAPKFWEMGEVVDFLCQHCSVKMSLALQKMIYENQEISLAEIYHRIQTISQHFGSNEVSQSDLASLEFMEVSDKFYLGQLLSDRQMLAFFQKLIELTESQSTDQIIGCLNFIKSHLFKISDPSYLQDKQKLTKYDKSIETAAKYWKRKDLFDLLKFLSAFEIKVKKNEWDHLSYLRQYFLKSTGRSIC